MKRHLGTVVQLALLGLAVSVPAVVTDSYYQHILNMIFLTAISVYGYNVITGIAGQFNIAHAGFIGIGAYVSALATTRLPLSFWTAMPLAIVVTAVFGVLIGYPSLRLRGVYFALTTLGFVEILSLVFENWVPVTGGAMGITRIPPPPRFTFPAGSPSLSRRRPVSTISVWFFCSRLSMSTASSSDPAWAGPCWPSERTRTWRNRWESPSPGPR